MADIRSMELLLAQARVELEDHRRLYESLEARATGVLGFAGVLIALLRGSSLLTAIGIGIAAAAALAALWTFVPAIKTDLDLPDLRQEFSSAEAAFTSAVLLDAQVRSWRRLVAAISSKAFRLRASIILLGSSIVILAIERVIP